MQPNPTGTGWPHYEPTSFEMLRRLADGFDMLRLMIETRKDQVARMDWTIRPREKRAADSRTQALIAWWKKPDGMNSWADWLRMVLEDVLVIDALSLSKRRDYAGNLLALEPIDGATIKPLVDDWGRIPEPMVRAGETEWPDAYQQILKGLPAVNYTANDLLYRPRNRRVNRVYGYNPVEQVMTTINIALRRQAGTLEYYTAGNVPDSLIGVPDTWTPDQIAAFQNHWDSLFEGNTGRRRKAKFVPGGVAKTFIQTREPELKNEVDEWLARIIAFAFSASPQPLLRPMNRASADTQKEIAEEEGLAPLLDWLKGLIDDVLADDLGAPELEFAWAEDRQLDEAKQAEILRGKASAGLRLLARAGAHHRRDRGGGGQRAGLARELPRGTGGWPRGAQDLVRRTRLLRRLRGQCRGRADRPRPRIPERGRHHSGAPEMPLRGVAGR
ncbi:phage portal protein [Methylobacterium currus]|uniref:phage portal protein n=1 Tax=Methylobacterium currus TaxID=2051553 RepID=UPI001E283FEB|nr:phage portal protein [Methylobacterium currus]UHC17296.1 phage portal protein [Methylobacterium currus]